MDPSGPGKGAESLVDKALDQLEQLAPGQTLARRFDKKLGKEQPNYDTWKASPEKLAESLQAELEKIATFDSDDPGLHAWVALYRSACEGLLEVSAAAGETYPDVSEWDVVEKLLIARASSLRQLPRVPAKLAQQLDEARQDVGTGLLALSFWVRRGQVGLLDDASPPVDLLDEFRRRFDDHVPTAEELRAHPDLEPKVRVLMNRFLDVLNENHGYLQFDRQLHDYAQVIELRGKLSEDDQVEKAARLLAHAARYLWRGLRRVVLKQDLRPWDGELRAAFLADYADCEKLGVALPPWLSAWRQQLASYFLALDVLVPNQLRVQLVREQQGLPLSLRDDFVLDTLDRQIELGDIRRGDILIERDYFPRETGTLWQKVKNGFNILEKKTHKIRRKQFSMLGDFNSNHASIAIGNGKIVDATPHGVLEQHLSAESDMLVFRPRSPEIAELAASAAEGLVHGSHPLPYAMGSCINLLTYAKSKKPQKSETKTQQHVLDTVARVDKYLAKVDERQDDGELDVEAYHFRLSNEGFFCSQLVTSVYQHASVQPGAHYTAGDGYITLKARWTSVVDLEDFLTAQDALGDQGRFFLVGAHVARTAAFDYRGLADLAAMEVQRYRLWHGIGEGLSRTMPQLEVTCDNDNHDVIELLHSVELPSEPPPVSVEARGTKALTFTNTGQAHDWVVTFVETRPGKVEETLRACLKALGYPGAERAPELQTAAQALRGLANRNYLLDRTPKDWAVDGPRTVGDCALSVARR